MKKLTLVFLIAGLFASCKKMKDPVFKGIENVSMNAVSMRSASVTLDIRYLNPNNFRGQLSRAEGDAWVDSVYLGHFVVDTTIHIPANSEFLVPVKLDLDMKQVLKHGLTGATKEEVTLKITGTARAGKSGFFKNVALNYIGKQNLKELFSPGVLPRFK